MSLRICKKTCEKHVATMFIDEVISNGDFIAIHWRYDKDDWFAANCKEGVADLMKQKCDQIHEESLPLFYYFC